MPATIEAGDLLLMFLSVDGNPTITTPSGWSLLATTTSGSAVRGGIYYKTAVGNEDSGVVAVAVSASEAVAAYVVALSLAGTPQASAAVTGDSENPDPPNLTPSGGALDWLWFAVCMTDAGDGDVQSVPSSYTERSVGSDNSINIGVGSRELNASSENPGTFDLLDTNSWIAYTLAIPPAAPSSNAARAMHSYRQRRIA